MRIFTEVLEEYLEERDRLNGNYYDNRFIGARREGYYHKEELAKELNEMIQGVKQ